MGGSSRLLDHGHTALLLDGPQAQRPFRPRAGEDDANRSLAQILGQRAKEVIDGHAHAPALGRLAQTKHPVSDRQVLARGSDVNVVGPDRCFLDNLRDLHTGVLAQQLDHHAFMGGIEVLDEHEGQPAVGGHDAEEFFE